MNDVINDPGASNEGLRHSNTSTLQHSNTPASTPTPQHLNTLTPSFRLAHLSDIHFGRIAFPEIVEHLVSEINAADLQLVVVSGDLTQRARKSQFRAAAAMLKALKPGVLVIPGNHDVYPWWRPLSRVFRPLARYRRFIDNNLAPQFEIPGLAVLGINSAYGRTIKGGHIGANQRHQINTFFSRQPAETFKILAVHHHLTQILALGDHDVARHARYTLEEASRVGVDLILCGHLHISHVEPLPVVPERHRIVVASAGTATSNRGRKTNRLTNFYNIIEVTAGAFSVEERRYDPTAGRFVRHRLTQFARLP